MIHGFNRNPGGQQEAGKVNEMANKKKSKNAKDRTFDCIEIGKRTSWIANNRVPLVFESQTIAYMGEMRSDPETKANAAFIVEACNAHDRLTEVNGELLAFAEATAKTFGADTMIAIEARAAIAKARKMGAKP